MRFRLRRALVESREQQEVNAGLVADLNSIAQFVTHGEGAPSHTPAGPEIYFEEDGPGVHIYNGGWVAL